MKISIKKITNIAIIFFSLLLSPLNSYAQVEPVGGSVADQNGNNVNSRGAVKTPSIWGKNYEDSQWYSKYLIPRSNESKYQPIIAIIGDGVDASFSDFKGRIVQGYDFTTNKTMNINQFKDFGSGAYYGTAISSLIISNKNKKFLSGLSSDALIMPEVVNSKSELTDTLIAKAIDYAYNHGADYIVFALGFEQYTINDKAVKSCESISRARKANILTFVDAYNSERFGDYSFKLVDCKDAVAVGSYDSNLGRYNQLSPEVQPLFSMPSGNISIINQGSSYLPYGVMESTGTAPALAAALFANYTVNNKVSKTAVLNSFLNNAISLNADNYFGKGIIYNYSNPLNLIKIKKLISLAEMPKVASITRDSHQSFSLTWQPVNTPISYYEVNTYKFTNKWVKKSYKFSKNSVRATIENFDIYDNAFVEVEAVGSNFKTTSMPSYDSALSVVKEEHSFPINEARIISSNVNWNSEGLSVSVESNDVSYNWDLLLIDPYSGEILKKYSVSGNSRLVPFDDSNPYRNKVLLVATGIGKNGVDKIIMPPYLLTASANAAGSDYASFGGFRNCINSGNVVCDYTGINEGDLIDIVDNRTGEILGSSTMREDGTFSFLIPYPKKDFSIRARAVNGITSAVRESSFISR